MSTSVAPGDPGVTRAAAQSKHPDRYKWIALSNTTIGVLMVTISGSITLISLPNIFDGIKLNPLAPGNTSYFLWMLMGFLLVTAVLVVSFGRVGDMYGRVKMYNLGFAVFTFFSILLSVTWLHGKEGALYLIIMRIFQGVGGAFLFANSSAILTDAFPEDQRGLALGINSVAAISGSFIGLLIGGVLAPIDWRLVFLVSVPFGLFGTIWAYLKLVDTGERQDATIDWAGNITFAIGLISILTGIVYSITPYGGHTMGWTNPGVIAALAGGVLTLIVFGVIETKATDPMFRLHLFKLRAFSAGNLANLLGALGRGGIQFILILWLQGIWLPQHGYSFSRTPLWAGIYMVPLTIGFLLAGPVSGVLSDRYGARPFATGGMVGAAVAFFLLSVLPINFGYWGFAAILLLLGVSMGVFASPNRAAVMNSLPPNQRGAGAGMMNTFQNASTVLSIGFFFALITIGMATSLPGRLTAALRGQGVSQSVAHTVGNTPPLDSLFSAFLGENPITNLNKSFNGAILDGRTHAQVSTLTGRSFFSQVLSSPFGTGLHYALYFAIACSLIAAVASLLRGKRYVHSMAASTAEAALEGLEDEAAADDGAAMPVLTTVGGGATDESRSFATAGSGSATGGATGHRSGDRTTGTSTGGGSGPVDGYAGNGHTHAGNGHAGNGNGNGNGSGHAGNGHVGNGNGNGHAGNGHAGNGQAGNGQAGNGNATTPTGAWSAPAHEERVPSDPAGATTERTFTARARSGPEVAERTRAEVVEPAPARGDGPAVAPEPAADQDTSELSVTLSFKLTSPRDRRRWRLPTRR